MKRALAFACLLLVSAAALSAQAPTPAALADSARRSIEVATLAADPAALAQVRAFIDRAVTRYPNDAWLLHYRGYALYREANVRQGRNAEDTGTLLEHAQEALEASLAKRDIPETRALLSAVLGQRIGANPMRGMTLGPRSSREIEQALEAAPNNPRVWLINGIGTLHRPASFGGGADRAEQQIRRALSLFPQDKPEPPAPAWGHDEAWLWLGRILEQKEKLTEARAAYRRVLELQPGNSWVRAELLPRVEKKLSGGG